MDASNLISNLGFPIFVAVWMMYQNQKLTAVINDLKIAITELTAQVKDSKEE
jgi:hypothetical protein